MSFEWKGETYDLDLTDLQDDWAGLIELKRVIKKRMKAGGMNQWDPNEENMLDEALRDIEDLLYDAREEEKRWEREWYESRGRKVPRKGKKKKATEGI